MRAAGDKKKGTIRPDFDKSIDFQGAKITSDTGFLLMGDLFRHLFSKRNAEVDASFRMI
jgi:hypothetical protein